MTTHACARRRAHTHKIIPPNPPILPKAHRKVRNINGLVVLGGIWIGFAILPIAPKAAET